MDTSEERKGTLHSTPVICPPTVEHVRKIAVKWKFDLTEEELQDYTECMTSMLEQYKKLYHMAEPKPPVKYPRRPGYQPPPDENKLNAWYVKTDIHGATSGKLFGKTVAVKDNTCVAGVQMMNGSRLLEGYIPEFDATVVTRTLDAGGRILGKSACEDLSYDGNSFTSVTGPVLNPHDSSRSAGGSSSGSAALVSSGEVDLAIGGDQGGSLRIPASCCGIVALKPTYGLVPYTGAASMETTLDHLGPMARTVKDCALFLEVLAGPDGMDSRQPEAMSIPEYSARFKSDLQGFKIGIVSEGFIDCHQGVADIVKKAAYGLEGVGATVQQVSIPMHLDAAAIYCALDAEGSYDHLVRKAGAGPSFKGFQPTSMMRHLHRAMNQSPHDIPVTAKLLCLFGEFIVESSNYEFYCRSANLVKDLTAAYDRELQNYEALIMPTITKTVPKLPVQGSRVKDLLSEAFAMSTNTRPFNATGHPALSINAGFTQAERLPVGLMIVGKKWHEQDVLDVAYALETSLHAGARAT